MVAKPFIFFLVLRFYKIRQYYCRQQNSNFHPVLGESLLRLILLLYFFFQSLMLIKSYRPGNLNLMSSNLIILLSLLFICFDFKNVLLNIYFFFTFLTLGIRVLKSRLGEKAIALGLAISSFNTFHYIHTKVRLRAVSYVSFESQWADSTEHT